MRDLVISGELNRKQNKTAIVASMNRAILPLSAVANAVFSTLTEGLKAIAPERTLVVVTEAGI